MAWPKYCCSYETTIAIRILGKQVTVNEQHPVLLFFLRHCAEAGEGITMSYWRAKTDGEILEPPAGEMDR